MNANSVYLGRGEWITPRGASLSCNELRALVLNDRPSPSPVDNGDILPVRPPEASMFGKSPTADEIRARLKASDEEEEEERRIIEENLKRVGVSNAVPVRPTDDDLLVPVSSFDEGPQMADIVARSAANKNLSRRDLLLQQAKLRRDGIIPSSAYVDADGLNDDEAIERAIKQRLAQL